MLKLSRENFIKARDYIFANSDDINRAYFRYHFEGSGTDTFMDVLAKYQHENGGFGGLNYEFDYQGSCLKGTEHAIAYILGLNHPAATRHPSKGGEYEKPPPKHPVIQKMMKYILDNYRPDIGNWGEPYVPEINDGAHCRWVRFKGETPLPLETEDERIRHYGANEKVCFAAFVAYYSEIVPEQLYRDIIKYPIEKILRYWDETSPDYNKAIFDEGSPYDFDYFQWFVPCLKDEAVKDKLAAILRQNPTAFMELDYTKSDKDYVHLPCDSVASPSSFVYPAVKDYVDDSLTYRLKQQSNDGRWPLGWSFGKDEKLQKLQKKYEAHGTLLMLVKLKKFGRIDM